MCRNSKTERKTERNTESNTESREEEHGEQRRATHAFTILTGVVSVHVNIFCTKMSPLEPINWTQITYFTVTKTKVGQEIFGAIGCPDVDAFSVWTQFTV
jgi:hypothetical protein